MRAKYYISFDGKSSYSEFFPSNEPVITWNPEGDEMFMRPKVDKFKIAKEKNATIYAELLTRFFDSAYFTTDINYKIEEKGVKTYEFADPVINGSINTETSVYEGTPEPDDQYRHIMKKYTNKYVHLTPTTVFAVNDNAYADQSLESNTFVNQPPPNDYTGWSDVSGNVGWANNAGGNARAWLTITDATPVDIICKITAFSGTPMILRGINAGGVPVGADVTINAVGTYVIDVSGATYVEAFNNSLVLVTGTFSYKFYTINSADDIISGGDLRDCLVSCFNSFMQVSVGTPVSTILWNDTLPTGHAVNTPNISTYITANPNNDYVLESPAILNDLWLSWVDHYMTYHEFKGEISLKDVMDILKKLRLFWYIDEDGLFRIEHEKYFRDYISQANITSATYISDKPEIDRKKYTYSKDRIFAQTNFNEANQYNEDWIAQPIYYDQVITGNINSVTLNVSTDFKNIHDNPDKIQGGGLVLTRMIQGTTFKLLDVDASTKTPGNFYMNAKLGWYFVLANYHKWFSSAETGTVNGSAFTFDHVKEFLNQNDISFHMDAVLDWKKPLTVELGEGWLTSAKYVPDTGMYTVSLAFNPYDL